MEYCLPGYIPIGNAWYNYLIQTITRLSSLTDKSETAITIIKEFGRTLDGVVNKGQKFPSNFDYLITSCALHSIVATENEAKDYINKIIKKRIKHLDKEHSLELHRLRSELIEQHNTEMLLLQQDKQNLQLEVNKLKTQLYPKENNDNYVLHPYKTQYTDEIIIDICDYLNKHYDGNVYEMNYNSTGDEYNPYIILIPEIIYCDFEIYEVNPTIYPIFSHIEYIRLESKPKRDTGLRNLHYRSENIQWLNENNLNSNEFCTRIKCNKSNYIINYNKYHCFNDKLLNQNFKYKYQIHNTNIYNNNDNKKKIKTNIHDKILLGIKLILSIFHDIKKDILKIHNFTPHYSESSCAMFIKNNKFDYLVKPKIKIKSFCC